MSINNNDSFARVLSLKELTSEQYEALMKRSETDISDLLEYVGGLTERVKNEGDKAVREMTAQFDKVDLGDMPLRVQPEEFDAALSQLEPDVLDAIDLAIANIKKVHENQAPPEKVVTDVMDGVTVGELIRPLESVALYVPRGKGSFPSVVMMLAIPAIVAGVKRPVVITPPGENGEVDAATLVVAKKVGVTEVYRVGGPQAIGAIAFGTESIPKVLKVLGPGNSYVTAAKRVVSDIIDPGIPAGPSEAVILADDEVDPVIAANDLLIEAEHGPDSCSVLVVPSKEKALEISAIANQLIEKLPAQRQEFIRANFEDRSCILWSETLDKAVDFVNAFAPEHLEILTTDPVPMLDRIHNAGEIMLGQYTPITFGNFCAGSNAILPTGGLAKSRSCLGVQDFQKRSSYVHVTEQGFSKLSGPAVTLAEYEGFSAHAEAVRARDEQKKAGN